MGIENFVETLYSPEEALMLCEGKLRGQSEVKRSILSDINVIDAAEILIALDDADNLCSQSDVVERAISYGWSPVGTEAIEKSVTVKAGDEGERTERDGWRSVVFKTAKFLLKVSSM